MLKVLLKRMKPLPGEFASFKRRQGELGARVAESLEVPVNFGCAAIPNSASRGRRGPLSSGWREVVQLRPARRWETAARWTR